MILEATSNGLKHFWKAMFISYYRRLVLVQFKIPLIYWNTVFIRYVNHRITDRNFNIPLNINEKLGLETMNI